MDALITVVHHEIPLSRPYALSFGTITHFSSYYVHLQGKGKHGMGEITPLPGYGHETDALIVQALGSFAEQLESGIPYLQAALNTHASAPMTGSGLICAVETWEEGLETAFHAPVPSSLPLAAFCPGNTPEEIAASATDLVGQGYKDLKLKVGRMDAAKEAELVQAACAALPPEGSVRIDANQRSSFDHALALCSLLEGYPVAHFEQPFGPHDWEDHSKLAERSTLPILLDESIENLSDIKRAANSGISAVKLKLCKHPGMNATEAMISLTRECDLGVIFGNGVQSALGNHLEARIANACALNTGIESNGFAKMAHSPMEHRLRIAQGRLVDNGLTSPSLDKGEPTLEYTFPIELLSTKRNA
ncbi:MAG: hypothetical protein KKB70_11415 [Proteobacteria bacterium]|nr:hypothetical protein [Pseudomonadota bacterium]